MEMKLNDKVLAMYQAVWALLEEGCDIHKMKVADITNRAGIGKGTAYEYFRTKEELLANALEYDLDMKYSALAAEVEKQNTLKQAVESCFVWLEKNMDRRFAMQIFDISRAIQESGAQIPCSFDSVERQMDCGVEKFRPILEAIVTLGREEGLIRPEVSDKLAQLEIFSKIIGFFGFLQFGDSQSQEEMRQTKAFLYDNIVKSLK
ncbi:MAG: TetR/AcrR family transcriptional regulator [Eubacteriales bacterium]|nr:TetR/AcrR family transcriptional regulator [Eubacteriales bacterium]